MRSPEMRAPHTATPPRQRLVRLRSKLRLRRPAAPYLCPRLPLFFFKFSGPVPPAESTRWTRGLSAAVFSVFSVFFQFFLVFRLGRRVKDFVGQTGTFCESQLISALRCCCALLFKIALTGFFFSATTRRIFGGISEAAVNAEARSSQGFNVDHSS